MSKWISVKDKMPNCLTDVIVYDEFLDIVDKDFYNAIYGWNRYPNVTHWQHFPKPPED